MSNLVDYLSVSLVISTRFLGNFFLFVSEVVLLLLSIRSNHSPELIKKPRHGVYSSSRWSFFYNYILYQLQEYSFKWRSTYVAENMIRLQTSFVRCKCNNIMYFTFITVTYFKYSRRIFT